MAKVEPPKAIETAAEKAAKVKIDMANGKIRFMLGSVSSFPDSTIKQNGAVKFDHPSQDRKSLKINESLEPRLAEEPQI